MAPSTWVTTLVDVQTGTTTHVGSFENAREGNIRTKSQMGIEFNAPCKALRATEVVFGSPTSVTAGAGSGSVPPKQGRILTCAENTKIETSAVDHGGLRVKVVV